MNADILIGIYNKKKGYEVYHHIQNTRIIFSKCNLFLEPK